MLKAIIFDADGVLLLSKHGGKRFSQFFSEKFKLPIETMAPFFQNEFIDCLIGKKDLKEELPKQMEAWKWKKSVEELLEFWFTEESKINKPLIKLLPALKKKGLKLYLGTNNEKHRTKYLLEEIGLNKHLHKAYASYAVGHKKPAKEFFEHIINDLKLPPNQILFIDDDQKNVAAAKQSGMNAEFYKDFESFKKDLKKYI